MTPRAGSAAEAVVFETGTNQWRTLRLAGRRRGSRAECRVVPREPAGTLCPPRPAGWSDGAAASDRYVSDPSPPGTVLGRDPYHPRSRVEGRGSAVRLQLDPTSSSIRTETCSPKTSPSQGPIHARDLRLDHRHRLRLGGQADRRLPRRPLGNSTVLRRADGRIPDAPGRRDHERAASATASSIRSP